MQMLLRASRPWLFSQIALRAYARPPAFAATCRCYAVGATGAADAAATRTRPRKYKVLNPQLRVASFPAATVIPHSVHQDDDTLLDHVKALSVMLRADKQRFCLVLATPAFASRLRDPCFVAELLLRMHRRSSPQLRHIVGLRLDALCAVVDKLPINKSRASSTPMPAAAGYEGIAYVSLPPMCSVPSPSAAGAIDFVFPTPTSHDRPAIQRLRLPLANTLFHTGTPTTMFLHVYTNPGPDQPGLRHESTTPLAHHQVRIDPYQPGAYINPKTKPTLTIPLLPLTELRRVKTSMGNIVRRIVGPDGGELTASSELEEAVSRFFNARDETPQATTAWALIIPPQSEAYVQSLTRQYLTQPSPDGSRTPWETIWRQEIHMYDHIVSTALARGARLHRVLSGGGGWGQKAGLISLDPVPTHDIVPSSVTERPKSAPIDPTDFASTLTPVVNNGDFIQFFIQPTSCLAAKAVQRDVASEIKALSGIGALGWELGTVPSTVDSIPGQSWQYGSSTAKGGSTVTRSFGALTEGPLQLTQYTLDNPLEPVTTTLDVPFTRLIYRCGNLPSAPQGEQRSVDSERKVGAGSGRAQNIATTTEFSTSAVPKSGTNPTSTGPHNSRNRSSASPIQRQRFARRKSPNTLVKARTFSTSTALRFTKTPVTFTDQGTSEGAAVPKNLPVIFRTARLMQEEGGTPGARSARPVNVISSATASNDQDDTVAEADEQDVHSALRRFRSIQTRWVLTEKEPTDNWLIRERIRRETIKLLRRRGRLRHFKTQCRRIRREIDKIKIEHEAVMQCLADRGHTIPYLAPPIYYKAIDIGSIERRFEAITHSHLAISKNYKTWLSQCSLRRLDTVSKPYQPREPDSPRREPPLLRKVRRAPETLNAAYATHLLVNIAVINQRLAQTTYKIFADARSRTYASPRSRRRARRQIMGMYLRSSSHVRVSERERQSAEAWVPASKSQKGENAVVRMVKTDSDAVVGKGLDSEGKMEQRGMESETEGEVQGGKGKGGKKKKKKTREKGIAKTKGDQKESALDELEALAKSWLT